MPASREIPWRRWTWLAVGVAPALVFFFAYNVVRFGSPFESGYALATLPEWLERQRALGLFSLAHLPMNLDYFLFHLTTVVPEFPWFRPDGLGLSVLITSPGLLYAVRADWRDRRAWWLAGAALFVLDPVAPVLRRRLAAVRLSLLPRFGAVRHRPVRLRRRPSGPDRLGLARSDRVRRRRHGHGRVLGAHHLSGVERY